MGDLVGAKAKTARAGEHFASLQGLIGDFFKRGPFEAYEEAGEKSGTVVVKVRVSETIPVEWSTVVGDVVHNLRSALDLAACDVVQAGGGKLTENTGFPVANGQKDLPAHVGNRLKGSSSKAHSDVRALQPFKGGTGHDLWLLHRLDILDKHQLLFTVGAAYRAFVLNLKVSETSPGVKIPLKPEDRMYPLKDGDSLFGFQEKDRKMVEPLEFHFDVAFSAGTVVAGESVPETLARLRGAVDGALSVLSHHV